MPKKINIVVFDAERFAQDLIKIIQDSNAIMISKGIPGEIYREIIKTALIVPKNPKIK